MAEDRAKYFFSNDFPLGYADPRSLIVYHKKTFFIAFERCFLLGARATLCNYRQNNNFLHYFPLS